MQRWPLAVLHAHCFSWSHLVFHAVALYRGLALWIAAEEMPAMRGGGEGTSFAPLVWGTGKGGQWEPQNLKGAICSPGSDLTTWGLLGPPWPWSESSGLGEGGEMADPTWHLAPPSHCWHPLSPANETQLGLVLWKETKKLMWFGVP